MTRGEQETVGQGYKAPRRFNIAQRWRWLYDIFHKRVTGGGSVTANSLVIPSGTNVIVATLEAVNVVGVVEELIASAAEGYMKVTGHAWVRADQAIAFGQRLKAGLAGAVTTFIDSAIAASAIGDATTLAGDDFGNQPANDTVDVKSSSASDITQTVTVYGLENGGTVIVSEAIGPLTGTSAVNGATSFDTILAVVIDAVTVGNITVEENSGGADITVVAAGTLQEGYNAITAGLARYAIPDIVASGASTKYVGIVGTDDTGAAQSEQIQLTGATKVALANSYQTITHVYTGDVEAAQTVSVTVADEEDDENISVGKALEAVADGAVCEIALSL